MENIFFACNWLILPWEPPNTALALVNTTLELGGFLFSGAISNDEQGFYIWELLVSFPSSYAAQKFVSLAEHNFGMKFWYPVSMENDSQTYINISWIQTLSGFVETCKMLGSKNNEIRSKLTSDNEK